MLIIKTFFTWLFLIGCLVITARCGRQAGTTVFNDGNFCEPRGGEVICKE